MSFSFLPPDVRIEIYSHILYSLAIPTPYPEIDQQKRRRLTTDSFEGKGVWTTAPRNPILSLLLVNRTIYFELQKALVLFRQNPSYHVDIMFLKTHGLWPTWSVPTLPLTQHIDNVYARFRAFHPVNLDERFSDSLDFRHGCGGPPLAVWSFYRLLTGLLVKGPGYRHGNTSDPSNMCRYSVRNIIINIDTSDSHITEAHNSWPPEDRDEICGRTEKPDSRTIERRLADYLEEYITVMLEPDCHNMNYGLIVYESVLEDIVLLVDDKESKRWNIDKLFHELEVADWGRTPEDIKDRKERYKKWKNWTKERRSRIRQGLEIVGKRPDRTIF